MKKKQKDVFLDGEANAWFKRNHAAVEGRVFGEKDPVIKAISGCLASDAQKMGGKLLDVGCGEG